MVVYALGALPGDAQLATLRTALQDAAPDVRWNAAVALARHGNHEGVPVLRQMLDREYVEQTVKRDVRQDDGSGSDRGRDDQRASRRGCAEGRSSCERRSTR